MLHPENRSDRFQYTISQHMVTKIEADVTFGPWAPDNEVVVSLSVDCVTVPNAERVLRRAAKGVCDALNKGLS